MSAAKKILDELYLIRRRGYGKDLPGQNDSRFLELAATYADSGAAERQAIRDAVRSEMSLLIIGFSERLAIVADRTKDESMIYLAALAHSIEDFRYDERENICRLALVHHVAIKLGQDPSAIFEAAARLSSGRAARALRAFVDRPASLKSLRAMGIVEQVTPDGVDYEYQE